VFSGGDMRRGQSLVVWAIRDGTGKRFIRTSNTATISTDGSIISLGKQKGKEQGPGCWAFIVHATGVEVGGWVSSSTNNRMELQAVIAAIKSVDPKNR
jgi:hypothetical protein